MADVVRVSVEGVVGRLTIDRPERRNALNLEVKQALVAGLATLDADPAVAVVVLSGSGGNFVAGTDIAEMAAMRPTDHVRLGTDEVFHALRRSAKPVIAAVEGYALGGGCELAMACDLIVAARTAQFGQPEIRVGIMPGAGGTQRLMRAAGRHRAALWCLTGQMIPAAVALSAGLVSELVDEGEALPRALALGATLAAMPPLAVQGVREALRLGEGLPLEPALALERRLFERLFDSDDQKEGMAAFLEKRRPVYVGR